jgi:hypothetical protein
VLDISDPTNVTVVKTWDPQDDGGLDESRGADTLLHSVGVSEDGNVGYLSYQSAGMLLLDTSDIAAGAAVPQLSFLHGVQDRVDWSPPEPPGVHSAVEIPGRSLAIVTDEVYPQGFAEGCPWGWMRIVDYSDPSAPFVASEYKTPENDGSLCTAEGGPAGVAHTAHNTTATENLAFITWHGSGMRAVDVSDPTAPTTLAVFNPEPIPEELVQDPGLGQMPTILWSYPIIRDGLIYVIDIRNGLYIVRYTGPHDEEIESRSFLEGNSNLR